MNPESHSPPQPTTFLQSSNNSQHLFATLPFHQLMDKDYTKMTPDEQLTFASHLRRQRVDPATKKKERSNAEKVITGKKKSASSISSDLI